MLPPGRSRQRRRRRCPRRSAASATGTTASAGCATRPSRSRRSCSLGCPGEAEAFFWWLLHASQLTRPRLQVLYRLDGGERAPERTLELDGYRGSRPVRVGNDAAAQTQLDVYGDLLQTALIYAEAGGRVDRETGRRLAAIADLVCRIWRQPDSGIWEVRSRPLHFTHSKMMCWVALDRAVRLSDAGHVPSRACGDVAA